VQIAGARIAPGDWIYCDGDGVIVSSTCLTA
jgi:regulator of RNase E activity RraA